MKREIKLILSPRVQVFLRSLPAVVERKIRYNIHRVLYEEHINRDLFKKLNDYIWEFRTQYNGNAYRLFAFWDNDTETIIVATHGIIKKTVKTPSKEIVIAEQLRKEYFEHKKKGTKL